MICADLHSHTIFSACGIHTHLEMLSAAKNAGLQALAITDHGPALHPKISSPFYERFVNPIEGIMLLKGMECNCLEKNGTIDLPSSLCRFMDIVLLGIHPNIPIGKGKDFYTSLLVNCIENNRTIDIITHPNESEYPLDFHALAEVAKKHGVALEINNSKTLYKRVSDDITVELIKTCRDVGCFVTVNSDAHAVAEIGTDESVRPLLALCEFPEELIINRNLECALDFIEKRRFSKREK